MNVRTHVMVGLVVSILLLFFHKEIGLFYVTILFLSSVLIDVDHYIFYAYITGDWSLKRAYYAFVNLEESNNKKQLLLFHGVECWIVLLMLTCLHSLFIYVCIGVALHIILDLLFMFDKGMSLFPKLSQIFVYLDTKHQIEDFK